MAKGRETPGREGGESDRGRTAEGNSAHSIMVSVSFLHVMCV